eukprot:TRINITY_DN9514_c0_g2_i10.p1 TRINITY_DN9514_c0_g2~~TRINITY_DN9514_c0_g2_i10.p1  ORF type:complete len:251 (+),score=26.46 TRINITY_DN9514_c0_g2_i10:202-954(+)
MLTLTFTEIVITQLSSDFLAQNMKVYMLDIECELEWKFNSPFKSGATFQSLKINIKPKCSLKGKSEVYVVEFSSRELITDTTGNEMAEKTYMAYSLRYVYVSDTMKEVLEAAGEATNSITTFTFLGLILISILQFAVLGTFWIFINTVQFISYLPVINCYLPYCFTQFLANYLKIKNVTIPFQLLPDSLWTPLKTFAVFLTEPFNSRLLENGYESVSFLYNFAEELITWIGIALLYLLLLILTRIISKEK